MLRTLALALLLLVPARAVAEPDPLPIKPDPQARREAPRRPLVPRPAAPPPSLWRHHRGLTVEAGVGMGSFRGSREPALYGSQQALAGPNLGLGWFITPRLAVGLRVAGVYHHHFTGEWLTETFAGASAQVWLAPYAWVSAGAGVGVIKDVVIVPRTDVGFALDARLGLVFNRGSRHAFSAAFEASPAWARGFVFSGLSVVAGYQFL